MLYLRLLMMKQKTKAAICASAAGAGLGSIGAASASNHTEEVPMPTPVVMAYQSMGPGMNEQYHSVEPVMAWTSEDYKVISDIPVADTDIIEDESPSPPVEDAPQNSAEEPKEAVKEPIPEASGVLQKKPVTTEVADNFVRPGDWYVTNNEYTDRVGNLLTIYNFCAYEWGNARQWLVENYKEGWPYGPVKDTYPAKNWGQAVAMATAACCVRECSTTPDILQIMNFKTAYSGVLGTSYTNEEIYEILKHPAAAQGYGLIGFTFGNLQDLVKFAEASGLDARKMETQLYFLAYQYYAKPALHRQYEYLEAYNDSEVTLDNVKHIAQIHTSVIGMCNKPTVYYSKPTVAVKKILDNWGYARYADFLKAAPGAYECLVDYATTGIVPR